MKRREFIALFGSAVIAWPCAARAQPPHKMAQIGVLVAESAPHPFTEAFRAGMRELGYAEGRASSARS